MGWKGLAALPNYFGGKQRLCPVIFREIAAVHPERTWPDLTLIDAFMGAGSVSLYAKAQGFRVLANDKAWRCYLIGKGLIENNNLKLSNQDLGLLFEKSNDCEPFVQRHYVPHTFSPKVAKFLDQAFANLRDAGLEETHEALLYTALIRFMLMIRVGGQMTNRAWCTNMSSGDFDNITQGQLKAGFSRTYFEPIPARMRRVQQHLNGGIFIGQARVFQQDTLAWLPEQQADLVYLDPPYFGSTSYEANYFHLDCILEGKRLPLYQKSPFNRRETGWMSLVQMFEAADHIPTWVFSFADNENGFSKGQVCGLIEDFGRTPRVVPLKHRWSIATEMDHYEVGAKELLIVCTP